MANRSDYNSVHPRQDKRLLIMSDFGSPAKDKEIRYLFLEAHSHAKRSRIRRLAAREVRNPGDSAD